MIESDPQVQNRLRKEFQSIRNETTASLNTCIQSLPTERKEPFQHLAEELERYWSEVDSIFALRATREGTSSILESVATFCRKYAEVLAITKEVSAVNASELKETDRRIAETFAAVSTPLACLGHDCFQLRIGSGFHHHCVRRTTREEC